MTFYSYWIDKFSSIFKKITLLFYIFSIFLFINKFPYSFSFLLSKFYNSTLLHFWPFFFISVKSWANTKSPESSFNDQSFSPSTCFMALQEKATFCAPSKWPKAFSSLGYYRESAIKQNFHIKKWAFSIFSVYFIILKL